MKLKGLILVVAVIIFSMLITLTGCDGKSNDKSNTNQEEQTQKEPEEIKMKTGPYGYVATGEDDGLYDGDVTIELNEGGVIMLYDGFAGLAQQGTYEIKGNKIVGTYTKAFYIDHTNGGDATKDISDKFEFEIVDEDTIKDLVGYGASFDNIMMKDALYRYNNVSDNTME